MLNMNVYRNLHHTVNNQIKQLFEPIESVNGKFCCNKITVSYKVEKRTKRKFDTFNIVSVVDKFFLDWLIKWDYLPDDTFNNVEYGSITGKNDCEYDRVIATIETIDN